VSATRNIWDRGANAWRRLIDTATVTWDTSTPGEARANAVFTVAPGSIGTAELADGAVTYAKLQNISAQFRALGRNSSGAGDAEEVTLTQLLDWIGSAARGDILVRGASAWARLPVGNNGQVLQSDGTDPAWVTPASGGGITTIASGNLSGNAVTITGIPETYAYLVLQITGGSFDTGNRTPLVRASVNNGSSYDATAGNYPGTSWDGTTFASATLASLVGSANVVSAGTTWAITFTILGYQTGPRKCAEYLFTNSIGAVIRGQIWYTGSTDNIDALQIINSGTGNFDAGTYALYGVS
jgi:hypothetical protein